MKLLAKKVIDSQVASQKKQQIDDGVKLAIRVDTLRQTKAQEEKNLEEFRVGAVRSVSQEIEVLTIKRDSLRSEVTDLMEQAKLNQIPLDKEWNKLNIEKSKLLSQQESLEKDRELLEKDKTELVVSLQDLEIEKSRVESIKDQTVLEYGIAHRISEEVEKDKRNIEILKEVTFREVEEIKNSALRKETEIDFKLVNLNNREIILKEKEVQIIKTKLQLEDQRGTLERALNRLNK